MKFEFSRHALEQMALREISKSIVEKILASPEQINKERDNTVYQSIVEKGGCITKLTFLSPLSFGEG